VTHSNTNPRSGQHRTHVPTASTCVVWSWRLKWCSIPASAVKGRLHRAFSPTSARRLCYADEAISRPKQLSMAATARVKWLCACVRYWPERGLVFECVTFFYCRLTLNLSTHRSALAWSTFSAHVALELPCSSQPTTSICVVWSWRLKRSSVPALAG